MGVLIGTANSTGVFLFLQIKNISSRPFLVRVSNLCILQVNEEKWAATSLGNIKKDIFHFLTERKGEFYFRRGNRINMLYGNNCWVELLKSNFNISLSPKTLPLFLSPIFYILMYILYIAKDTYWDSTQFMKLYSTNKTYNNISKCYELLIGRS